jgi:hypothetical protein
MRNCCTDDQFRADRKTEKSPPHNREKEDQDKYPKDNGKPQRSRERKRIPE